MIRAKIQKKINSSILYEKVSNLKTNAMNYTESGLKNRQCWCM